MKFKIKLQLEWLVNGKKIKLSKLSIFEFWTGGWTKQEICIRFLVLLKSTMGILCYFLKFYKQNYFLCNPILKPMLYSIFMQISNTGKEFMLRTAGTLRHLSLQYWRRHYQGLCMNLCSTKMDKAGNEEFLHIGAAWEIKWRKQQQQNRGQKDDTLVQAEGKKDKAESEKKCVLVYFIKDQAPVLSVS